ncbi:MAG: ABC transporter ATP-binding protein [Rhodothermales bacterium]
MISVDALSYTYGEGHRPAVDGIDFDVEDGEIFGFLGPSGAGKSTTQNILIGLLRDYRGSVRVLGQDLDVWGPELYEHVGIAFEFPNHYLKLTALENLRYFASLYAGQTEDPHELLQDLRLAEDAEKPVAQYSKGMRVRLSLARALVHRPKLLFLDEPTAGLDPGTSRVVRELIRRKRKEGATIFLTTHDMVAADDLCDRVAFLVEGRIALIEAPRNLKLQYGERTVRVETRGEGRLVEHEFALDGLSEERPFLDLLKSGTIEAIHTQEATLEEIFIQVTGSALT